MCIHEVRSALNNLFQHLLGFVQVAFLKIDEADLINGGDIVGAEFESSQKEGKCFVLLVVPAE